MSYYLHHVPGRLRVRNPALKGKPLAAQSVQRQIAQIPGIHSIDVNVITGSILVHYDRQAATAEKLLSMMKRPQTASPRRRTKRSLQSHLAPAGRVAASWAAEKMLDFVLERALFALVAAVI